MNHRTRVNPFEMALWILSVALVVAGLVALIWAMGSFVGNGIGGQDRVVAQVVYTVAPSAVLAGLVGVILALAVRALLLGGFRRAAVAEKSATAVPTVTTSPPASPSEGPDPRSRVEDQARTTSAEPTSFEPPRFRQRQRAIDHSAFKRPGAQ